jgi:hypothetical protein
METHFVDLLRISVAVFSGGMIGLGFGALQRAALRRHEERARAGRLASGWSLMPGSGVRVAYLLIGLVLVQLICPLLFVDGIQWCVSAGLVLGYGYTLWRTLQQRRSQMGGVSRSIG